LAPYLILTGDILRVKELIHLTEGEIVEYNRSVLRTRVKKADSHKVLSEGALRSVVAECKEKSGKAYDIAVCLIKNLIQKHPFASGNRRTAWVATESFLEQNNLKLNVDNSEKQARVLQGIRENYYTDKEIKDWLITGKIRKFER